MVIAVYSSISGVGHKAREPQAHLLRVKSEDLERKLDAPTPHTVTVSLFLLSGTLIRLILLGPKSVRALALEVC